MFNKRDQSRSKQLTVSERREVQRYPFICSAELILVGDSTRVSARTADLSLQGCYIDTLNPFPVGTRMRLQLAKSDQRLELLAEVTSSHVGSGMGLIFEQLTSAQTDTLIMWLENTSSQSEPEFSSPASASVPPSGAKANVRFAMKLVAILERKGILSSAEAADLLRDC
jgi:hypothetical protein